MMADPKTYAEILDAIALGLEQTTISGGSPSFATATNLAPVINDGLDFIADYSPYEVLVRRLIESRSGTATSDTANALVDSTKSQFLSTDVGKVVYNSSTYKWGEITAYVSASQVTLDHDLFPDGNENYRIYNQGCKNSKQVNITGFPGYKKVAQAEYPPNAGRDVDSDRGGIVEIGYDGIFPDSDTADSTEAKVIAHLYVAMRHFVSQLTTFTGEIDGGTLTAGTTTIHVDGLTNADVIKKGQPFTIEGTPGVYIVTDDTAAVSSTEVDITFYPGLEVAIVNDDDVTFTKSTLTPELERILIKWCSGKMLENKSVVLGVKQFINASATFKAASGLAKKLMDDAVEDLVQIAIRDTEPIETLARY